MITFYQKNKERLQELAWNCHHQQSEIEKAKAYYENKKKIARISTKWIYKMVI